jgi:hypothetical protein
MARRQEGMTTRKCGCITFDFGPPVQCHKHLEAQQEKAEKGLRAAVRDQATHFGHDLGAFSEYESTPGKWTVYCLACACIGIVYDAPPERGDQIATWGLDKQCEGRGKGTTRG